jgi:P4 family phage/plasmid primase-like protien
VSARLIVPAVTPDQDTLGAALAYAAGGFYAGPLKAGTKHPGSILGKDWQRQTSRDPQVITSWFAGTNHGVFLHMGRSGAVGFDVDQPEKLHPAIKQAVEQYKPPFQSSRPCIPGKGHRVFGMPDGRQLGNSLGELGGGWGEIRGANGVIVAAPSVHPEGGEYRWLVTGPVPLLPGYLASRLPDALDAADAASDADVKAFLAQHSTPSSPRPELLDIHVQAFQKAVSSGESRHATMTGHLSGAMKEAAVGYLDAKAAADTLESVFLEAVARPPSGKQGALRTGALARNEWQGLLAWAVGQARAADPEETRQRVEERFGATPRAGAESEPSLDPGSPEPANETEELAGLYDRTDDGNALRLINSHRDRFRRVADMGKWFVWDGRRWAMDHDARAVRHAARDLARQWPQSTKEDAAFRANSLSATGISSCVRVAETDKRISILAAELDAYPELINTPSGVVDLRTGEPRPHDPKLLLTRITACPADIGAPHPRWDAFLAETFNGNREMIAYLQRLAGLALLGKTPEHVFPFLWGKGANGKTVIANVLQGLLGNADTGGYAVSAPEGFLLAGRDHKHETEIARLRGARLVVCSEQTSGNRFDESKIKKLTGGDILTGRYMRQDFFDFSPSHLLLVLSNFLPEVREGGPAFWRRVRLIPFPHVVPDDQQIKDFHEHLFAGEGPAILGWAVRGAVDVLANGLQDPQPVIDATAKYKISEDTVASFNQEHCLLGPHWWCYVSDYRERYERHCKDMGIREPDILSAKALTMRLTTEYDVVDGKRVKGKRIYWGITLQGEDQQGE